MYAHVAPKRSMSNRVGAEADLLVGREPDAHGGSRELGMGDEVRDGGHDLRHPRLVVGAEQRVPARRHDVVPGLARQHGHRRRVEHRPAERQLDCVAAVAAVHERLDARARDLRRGVDVREKSDCGTGAGQRGEDEAAVIHRRVVETELLELLDEQPAEVELAGRAGLLAAVRRRLGVDADVAQEALEHVRRERLRQR